MDHVLARQLVAGAAGQHRVVDQRDVRVVGDQLGDGDHVIDAADHADLERGHRHVFQHRARLVEHPFVVDDHEVLHAAGVLHRDGGDHRQRMAAHAGQGQDVGLDAGAAGGIGPRQRQHDGRENDVLAQGLTSLVSQDLQYGF
ncbi:hypothetical protein D3C85_1149530 [compost metagenome]